MKEKITVSNCVVTLKLEVVSGCEYLDREVTRSMMSRPGVEIYSDYFDFYESTRIQVIGTKEMNLFLMLDEDNQAKRVEKLFCYDPPAFIFTFHVKEIPPVFFTAAMKYHIPLLRSKQTTTTLISTLSNFLNEELAEKKNVHGVMLDINGVGVLLKGRSFVGKSETALELIHRGHALVSDDNVILVRKDNGDVLASSPKLTERLMEIRGLGIIDVVDLFGVKAFRSKKRVMLSVNLVKWETGMKIDRLGIDQETELFFDIEIPKFTIYVMPGRNLATLVEVAAMNWRLKSFGRNAAQEFVDKLDKIVKKDK